MQGGVNGSYLLNLFLNDLEIDEHDDIALFKYTDDTTALALYAHWRFIWSIWLCLCQMCGLDVCKWHMDASSKCNELLLHKKGNPTAYPVLHNIKQYNYPLVESYNTK